MGSRPGLTPGLGASPATLLAAQGPQRVADGVCLHTCAGPVGAGAAGGGEGRGQGARGQGGGARARRQLRLAVRARCGPVDCSPPSASALSLPWCPRHWPTHTCLRRTPTTPQSAAHSLAVLLCVPGPLATQAPHPPRSRRPRPTSPPGPAPRPSTRACRQVRGHTHSRPATNHAASCGHPHSVQQPFCSFAFQAFTRRTATLMRRQRRRTMRKRCGAATAAGRRIRTQG